MIESQHNFRSHVTRRARSVLSVLRAPDASNSEVCDAQIAIAVDDQVFRFDVSMNDLLLMNILKSRNKTSNPKS